MAALLAAGLRSPDPRLDRLDGRDLRRGDGMGVDPQGRRRGRMPQDAGRAPNVDPSGEHPGRRRVAQRVDRDDRQPGLTREFAEGVGDDHRLDHAAERSGEDEAPIVEAGAAQQPFLLLQQALST
jgi:hypothetical protein